MDWYMEKKETGRTKRIIRMNRYQLINRCWMIYFLIYLLTFQSVVSIVYQEHCVVDLRYESIWYYVDNSFHPLP